MSAIGIGGTVPFGWGGIGDSGTNANAANNGVSLSGTTVQLGSPLGTPGPSTLLNNREIEMDGNSFQFSDSGNAVLFLDPLNTIIIGDQTGSSFQMNYSAYWEMFDTAGSYFIMQPASISGFQYEFGDRAQVHNGTRLGIDDVNGVFDFKNTANTAIFKINGTDGFTGTVTPVTSITVIGGIVTDVS